MGIFIYPFPYTHFFKNIRNIPICNIPIFLKIKKIYPFAIFSYLELKEFYYSDFQKLERKFKYLLQFETIRNTVVINTKAPTR